MDYELIQARTSHIIHPAQAGQLVLRAIDTFTTSTGKATYHNDRIEVEQAEATVHDALFALDRGIYAALLTLPGVMDHAKQLGVIRLLDDPRNGAPAFLVLDEETSAIADLVAMLPTQRQLKLFLMLRSRGVNNARTRKVILRTILNWDDLDWKAIKYRRKIGDALTFAWGRRMASIIKSILAIPPAQWQDKQVRIIFNNLTSYCGPTPGVSEVRTVIECVSFCLGNAGPWTLDKLAAYAEAPTNYDRLTLLPPEVAEGFRSRFHAQRSKADVVAQTKERVTTRQRVTMQRQAKEAGVKIELKPETQSLVDLYVLFYETGMPDDLYLAIRQRADAMARTFRFPYTGKVAVILDWSASMTGSDTQKWRPAAQVSALHAVLAYACDDLLTLTGSRNGNLFRSKPSGATSLAQAVAQAAAHADVEAIFILSDGYENSPAGRTGEVVAALRQAGYDTPIYHVAPTFGAEGFGARRLADNIPIVPLGNNVEALPVALTKGMIEQDFARGLAALLDQTRLRISPESEVRESEVNSGHGTQRVPDSGLRTNRLRRLDMSTQRLTTFADLLRGLQPGHAQTVGVMQVIPLTGEELAEFGSPEQVKVSSPQYGTMVFDNYAQPQPTIVPHGAAYIVKEAAQDHAVPHVVIIAKGQRVTVPTAMCIQASQGGHFANVQQSLSLLPATLRASALRMRREQGYSRLWDKISAYTAESGAPHARAHLVAYLQEFARQLDEFVAEFEPVDGQLGAIVLINGRVVGVERVPSYVYWRAYWRPLIRECYGSLAMTVAKKEQPSFPETRRPLAGTFTSPQDVLAALDAIEAAEAEATRSVVRSVLSEPLTMAQDENGGRFSVYGLSSPLFVGQAVYEGAQAVYASCVGTEAGQVMAKKAFAI